MKNGRQFYGSAGAGLSHQAFNPSYPHKNINKTSARIGIEAERKTSDLLKDWIKDKPAAILIDSVHVKGFGESEVNEETGLVEGGDTDHVLVIGNEVLIIDTKRWKSKRSYSVSDKGAILRGTGKKQPPRFFMAGKINIRGALGIWRKYLGKNVNVFGIICINAEKVFVKRDANWYKQPFRVVTAETLVEFLDKRYEKITHQNKTTINTELICKIVLSAIKPYDEFKSMNLNMN